MKTGHRWLAFDADFFFHPHTKRIVEECGTAGVMVWIAFLCACKNSPTPGTVRYLNDTDLLIKIGLPDLVGLDMDALWTLNGRFKQTKRTQHGGFTYLTSTRWEEWQKAARRDANAQRMADKRRAHAAHTLNTNGAHDAHTNATEKEKEKDIPPTPRKRGEQAPSAHASPPPTPATPKPPCAACGSPALLVDSGADLCLHCYELGVVIVPPKAASQ